MITKVRTKAESFIAGLARETGQPEQKKEAREILKAVLHTLRDNITLDYSIDILTQLPPFLKEIYVENWKPSQAPCFINENLRLQEEVLKRIPAEIKSPRLNASIQDRIIITLHKLNAFITWNPPEFLQNLIPDRDESRESVSK